MGWVNDAVRALEKGETVQVRPQGGSMRGRIESGQRVTLAPVSFEDIEREDVILVRWKGNYILHLVKEKETERVLIGNNMGKINGWADASAVLAKAIVVEDYRAVSGEQSRLNGAGVRRDIDAIRATVAYAANLAIQLINAVIGIQN